MGEDQDAGTARERLRLLAEEFTTPTRHEPGPRRRTPTPAAPISLGVLDYLMKATREVADHTRAAVPDATAPPAEAADVYGWMYEQTAHLDIEHRMARDAMVYRQSLEHAYAMNDASAIRKEPCPACRCWSLFWQDPVGDDTATCVNRRCTDHLGRPSTWTLQELAQRHAAAKYTAHRSAT